MPKKARTQVQTHFQTNYLIVDETQAQAKPHTQGSHKRKRVGIIGGTFNPPHIGHLIMAQQCGEQLGLERVYFMPDANPPHIDHKEAIAAKHREHMVALAIQGNPMFALETIELRRGGKSYTVETMRELRKLHPEVEYYFLIGGDMVNYLPKWDRIDELVKLVQFVAVVRPGYRQEACRYPIIWVDSPTTDVSSTLIRERVHHGCSIRYLVPEAVRIYIQKEGLYRD